MVQLQTYLKVADNTGVKKIMCIKILGRGNTKYGRIGDIIVASVKEASADAMVKKGQVTKAVIVRTKKELKRKDGSYIRFDDNAAVLLTDALELRGTRIFGPIPRELREKFPKVVTLAVEVV